MKIFKPIKILLILIFSIVVLSYDVNEPIKLVQEHEKVEWQGEIENEFGIYDGDILDTLFTGEGSFRFISGETYFGNWENSYMTGNGSLTFPEIGVYDGEISYSKRNGQGKFKWYSGESYNGSWKDDKMSGDGIYTFSNGSVLEGRFLDNKPISGEFYYTYNTKKDEPDTKIISLKYIFSLTEKRIEFITKGGLEYKGDVMGIFGKGVAKIKYPSGNLYNGQILKGQRDGSGKFEWKDGSGLTTCYYDGDWESDHMNGQGKYHFTKGEYPYLIGNFENDVPSGKLIYFKEAGNTFDTLWEHGTCVEIKET